MEIDGQTFRTLATDGDVQLGGRVFDPERLLSYVAERFMAAYKLDPRSDRHDAAKLWYQAEESKTCIVATHGRRLALLPCWEPHEGRCLWFGLRAIDGDLLDGTQTTMELVLRQAKLKWEWIDRVLLVGGATGCRWSLRC